MTFTVSETISDETLNCIITIESAGRLDAKAGTSSALGLGQFLKATWLGVVKKHRPDLMEGRSEAQVLALRTDPGIAVELLARFTEDNQRIIGMNCTGGDLYLGHFLGTGDARKLFHADPSTPINRLVSADVIKANRSVMLNKDGTPKTAAQVRAWAANRMLQSRGHAWVAKYYAPPEPEPEPAPESEPAPEEIPDTQALPATVEDTPAAAVKPDDAKIVTGKAEAEEVTGEGWVDWATKLVKSRIQWATTSLGGISLASIGGAFHDVDWRIIAAVAAVSICLVVAVIVLRGRKP